MNLVIEALAGIGHTVNRILSDSDSMTGLGVVFIIIGVLIALFDKWRSRRRKVFTLQGSNSPGDEVSLNQNNELRDRNIPPPETW